MAAPDDLGLYARGFVIYQVERDSGSDIAIVGFGSNSMIAHAAFDKAAEVYPTSALQMRHRARIVRDWDGRQVSPCRDPS